jgi:hypothetical protein
MKVNKFSENTKMELIEKINNKEYVVVVYDKNKVQIYEAPCWNINKAIEKYYDYNKNYNENNNKYIFIVERESKVLNNFIQNDIK